MTLRKNIFLLLISPVLILNYSCKKNNTGGKAELHALIYHNDTPIKASTLYVKFDTQTQPSNPTEDYNLKLEGEEDDNHVHVEGMRPGEYYLYSVGYDSLAKVVVQGGAPAKIKWSERKKLIEVTIQVNN